MTRMGTHGRTGFKRPVKGRVKGNGMGGHKRGINRKFLPNHQRAKRG